MEPIQAIAARQVSTARKPAAEEIDAFYDDHALETLHAARRSLGQFASLLRATSVRLRSAVMQSSEIARAPGRG